MYQIGNVSNGAFVPFKNEKQKNLKTEFQHIAQNYNNGNATLSMYQDEKYIYGSSRLGLLKDSVNVLGSAYGNSDTTHYQYFLGKKRYELTNHLGNVLSVISDKPIPHDNNGNVDYWQADILQSSDYSAGGVMLSGRNFSIFDQYKYGHEGQLSDSEIYGDGNSYAYKYRMSDPRLVRMWSVDPLSAKYPYNSSYAFSENRVIDGVELEGLEFKKRMAWNDVNKSMYQLKNNPESINQTGAGTCVMAAITYIWIKRDFESFHKAIVGLYFVGHAQVNNFNIKPNANLFWVHPDNSRNSMNAPYDYGKTEDLAADWIILSSLQNSLHPDEKFYGYGVGKNSDATNTPSDIKFMMTNLLGLKNVQEKYYYGKNKDNIDPKKILNNLEGLKSEGNEIIMGINVKMLDPTSKGGGHAVNYMGNYHDLGEGKISFDVQTWGKKQTVTTTVDNFKENYNGATWGK